MVQTHRIALSSCPCCASTRVWVSERVRRLVRLPLARGRSRHALGPEASTELVATGEDLISMVLIDPLTFFSRFAAALAPLARALVPGQISETAGAT